MFWIKLDAAQLEQSVHLIKIKINVDSYHAICVAHCFYYGGKTKQINKIFHSTP